MLWDQIMFGDILNNAHEAMREGWPDECHISTVEFGRKTLKALRDLEKEENDGYVIED